MISQNIHQQTSWLSMNVLFISHNHETSANIHISTSLLSRREHWTNSVDIPRWFAAHEACWGTPQDPHCVEHASWLLCIPFWLRANKIFLRTSDCFLLSSSLELPRSVDYHLPLHFHTIKQCLHKHLSRVRLHQNWAQQQLPHPICHRLRHNYNTRHHSVQCDTVNAASENMPHGHTVKMVWKSGCSKNKKQHLIRWDYISIEVDGGQLKM